MAHPTKSAPFRYAPEAAGVTETATINKVSAKKMEQKQGRDRPEAHRFNP
ncbi:MAG TPA: hypothetical protein PLE48_01830 [Thiobacillus sp.]|nr:hypothetical protein [Thiobacillus sp.]